MKFKKKINRRDFGRWTTAAVTGLIAGGLVGCDKGPAETASDTGSTIDPTKPIEQAGVVYDEALLMKGSHVCRGLNTCKGHGSCRTANNSCKGKNACAGQGKCAMAEKHQCTGMNACKGQGGCGERPGENSCKGQGACGVPLSKKTWGKARAKYEKVMTAAGKSFGKAPALSP